MRTLCVTLLICLVSSFNVGLGQQIPDGERLRDLSPPDFGVGGVMYGYDGSFEFAAMRQTAISEFNTITAAFFMPYVVWEDPEQAIDTSGFTRLLDWANTNGMRVHGHTLIYPTENTNAQWLQELDDRQVERRMEQFVKTMARAGRNRVWFWDVVNEVIADDGDVADADGIRMGDLRDEGFRPYREYEAMGQDFIAKAFQWAREADPNAVLILNDYACEEINPKSDRLLAFCKKLRDAGVPIDGVGFQHHWIDTRGIPDFDSMARNMQRFADEGFQVFLTEVVVAATTSYDPINDPPDGLELERQQLIYQSLMEIALEQPMCKSFLMWDFLDDQSWLQNTDRPLLYNTLDPGAYMFGTIFWGGDTGGQNPIVAKNAYYGLQQALSNIPMTPYRFTSGWGTRSSYPVRDASQNANGRYIPESTVRLGVISEQSSKWRSMKWTLERVVPGVYRIRCFWGRNSGYLTRSPQVTESGEILAGEGVELTELNRQWLGQLWTFSPRSDGGYRVTNAWEPETGCLTRRGDLGADGNYQPGRRLELLPPEDWTSQNWYFDRTFR